MQREEKIQEAIRDKFDTAIPDFLLEDYRQKISYLTAHLGRMWTRFNFFLTAEVALIAYVFTAARDVSSVAPKFVLVELVLSSIWWAFGAQDRFLVQIYRHQIEDTVQRLIRVKLGMTSTEGMSKLADFASTIDLEPEQLKTRLDHMVQDYRYTSETDKTAGDLERRYKAEGRNTFWNVITAWRLEWLSITRLASIVPIILFLVWFTLGILMFLWA